MMELWGILDRNNPHVICCLLVKKASWFRNGEFTFFSLNSNFIYG